MSPIAAGASLMRDRREEAVSELDENSLRPHQREGVGDQLFAPMRRLVEERQAGDDGRDRRVPEFGERMRQIIGVALNDPDALEAAFQDSAEARVVFDEHKPSPVKAALDQGPSDRTGAGAEFDDEARVRRVDGRRHGARKDAPRGRHGPGEAWRRQKRSEEMRAVAELRPTFGGLRWTLHSRSAAMSASSAKALEELLHLRKEAGAFGVGLMR